MQKIFFVLVLISLALTARVDDIVLNKLSLNGKANIFVEFKDRLNFKKLATEKGNFDDMEESYRGHLIMKSLQEIASSSQKRVIEFLKSKNVKFESFWIDNKISIFDSSEKLVLDLSKFDEVSEIIEIAETKLDNEVQIPVHKNDTQQVEVGVEWINAPKVWAKGVKGKGIVVGNSDTGSVLHNDLKDTYRGTKGNEVEHDYNWFDAISTRPTPYDDHGHGTHCMGTKVGTSSSTKVGVSPESTWVVCKWLNAGGGGNAAGALKCLQWFLAPTKVDGTQPNPDLRPHVTSHSYRCSCNLGNAVKALIAAGVEVVVAAGNSGPRCSTVTEPAFFEESFGVGALNRGADTIASFSSKGPYQGRIKPDISAPGAQVRSCGARGGYVSMSGTSMACPHVAGAVALLWSGHPKLVRKIKESREILTKTAKQQRSNECSSNGTPNNVFGHGTVDSLKAHEQAKRLGY